nr:glutamine amidotransferase [Mycolicibacterium komanii]CRL68180.1 GMP synthase [Mycolicibacterium komanii]
MRHPAGSSGSRGVVPSAPFLLLSIRGEDAAAEDEYRAVMRFGGLGATGVRRINLLHEPLGSIDLADWSGIILGGGPYNVSDAPESKSTTQRRVEAELLDLIRRLVEADYPFLGCCYGVGTLGTVIGAVIDRTYPEPVGGMKITVTDAGRDDPLFTDLPDVFDAYGGHKEAAAVLPPEALCLATSPQCPVQAFRVGQNVYATQFHPELDLDGLDIRLDAYKNHGYFAPESAEQLKREARQWKVLFPQTILRRFVDRYAR